MKEKFIETKIFAIFTKRKKTNKKLMLLLIKMNFFIL